MSATHSPPASAFVPLDTETIRTDYLEHKAERLVRGQQVIFLPGISRAIQYGFRVEGDRGVYEPVWLQPFRSHHGTFEPIYAWCPKGGEHDLTPSRAACSHMLAAAVVFVRDVLPDLVARDTLTPVLGVRCAHPVTDGGACVTCGEVLLPLEEWRPQ